MANKMLVLNIYVTLIGIALVLQHASVVMSQHALSPCYAIPYSPYLQVEYSQQFDPFPHESWAELSCSSDSYEVQGEKRTQCLFGDWTYPQPTCIAASCSIADSELPAHSTVNTNEIAHGSSINYGCEEGYQIQDSANEDFINILCHYGLWSRTLPVCVEAKCTLLIGVTYDYSVIRGWEVAPGIDVTFTCDQGFQQSPSNGTVRCQKGEWRPHIPQCVQEGCELPTDIVPPLKLENPPIESIVQHGTSITYGCYDGFWLSDDNNEHECYQGVWSIHTSGGLFIPAERPTCIQSNTDISNGCSCPADRVNIVIFYEHKVVDNCNGRTFPHRAEITQRCSDIESFDFYGDTKRTCNSGQWSGEAARCEVAPFLFRISGHATRVIAEDGRLFVHASGEEFYIDCQKPSSVARNADWYRFDELRGSYFVGKRQWRRIRFYSDRTYQSGTYKCRRLLQGSQESYDERFIKVYIHVYATKAMVILQTADANYDDNAHCVAISNKGTADQTDPL
ncbi:E-selectin-like [Saccoglossus kowalevskii]